MYLKVLPYDLTICKTADTAALDLTREFYFIAKTDEELSLFCQTADAPACNHCTRGRLARLSHRGNARLFTCRDPLQALRHSCRKPNRTVRGLDLQYRLYFSQKRGSGKSPRCVGGERVSYYIRKGTVMGTVPDLCGEMKQEVPNSFLSGTGDKKAEKRSHTCLIHIKTGCSVTLPLSIKTVRGVLAIKKVLCKTVGWMDL